MNGATARLLADGRLHLQHGPIDLIVTAEGAAGERAKAFAAARRRFPNVLPELAGELPQLRAPLGEIMPEFRGPVARAMAGACWSCRGEFLTSMAAVAGAVADHMLDVLLSEANLSRAIVNNGGDIAFHLAPGQRTVAGVVDRPGKPRISGSFEVFASDPTRGIATSGWLGRSFSLGIADAVTILAATAAKADAAATVVANAVNTDHPAILREPAASIQPDSDLGEMLVTAAVGDLSPDAVAEALDKGEARAKTLLGAGLIFAAVLQLQRSVRVIGEARLTLQGPGD